MALLTRDAPESTTPHTNRSLLIGLALAGGAAIFVLGTPYFALTRLNDSVLFNGALVVGFGILLMAFRRRADMAALVRVVRALFIASAAMFTMVVGPFNWLITEPVGSVEHALQDKLAQFLCVVPMVLVLVWLLHGGWQPLYLRAGRSKRWLILGLTSVAIAAAVVGGLIVSSGTGWAELGRLAPWILGFAGLNAVMEELWFRGVFLADYTRDMGPRWAIAVTAVVFGAAHVDATYIAAGQQLGFAVLVVGLGVALAWLIRWADSIWGAVLFHVAADLTIATEFVEII